MGAPEPNLSDLVLRIDAAITEGREAELLAELDIPIGREDQLDAARDDLIGGLLKKPGVDHRDLGFADQPGWLRLEIMMAVVRWLDGQARTCPHNPVAEQPAPVHLALWLPDLVVCGECTHLLVPPEHPSCAGCGLSNEVKSEINSELEGSASPRLVIVVVGFVAVRVFACPECVPRE
ncbi:MAG: hypothetical protein M3325_05605 [Actinomycetota bacterium]|nr:hypothetical protein [Actinomycetota bacterium]